MSQKFFMTDYFFLFAVSWFPEIAFNRYTQNNICFMEGQLLLTFLIYPSLKSHFCLLIRKKFYFLGILTIYFFREVVCCDLNKKVAIIWIYYSITLQGVFHSECIFSTTALQGNYCLHFTGTNTLAQWCT